MNDAVGLAITTSGAKQPGSHVHVLQSGSAHQEFAGLMQTLAAAEKHGAASPQGLQPSEETTTEESTNSSSAPRAEVSSRGEKSFVVPQPKHGEETNSKSSGLQISGHDEVKGGRKRHADPVVKTAQSKAKSSIVNLPAIDAAVPSQAPRLSSLPERATTAPTQLLLATQTGNRAHDPSYELSLRNADYAPAASNEEAKAMPTVPRSPMRLGLANQPAETSLEAAGSPHVKPAHESAAGSDYGTALQPGDGRRQFGATVLVGPEQDAVQHSGHESTASASKSEVALAAASRRMPSINTSDTEKTIADGASVKTTPGQIQTEPTSEKNSVSSGATGTESGQASTVGATPGSGPSPLSNKVTSGGESASKSRSIGVDGLNPAATQTAIESAASSRELSAEQIPLRSDRVNGAHGNLVMPSSASTESQETFTALDSGPRPAGAVWTRTEAHAAEAGYQDPTLGWVGVRAQVEHGGVHAAVVPGSDSASEALSGHLSGLSSYLAERHVPVDTLSVTAPESRLDGRGAGAQGGNQEGQGPGDQSQPSPQRNAQQNERPFASGTPARIAETGLSTSSPQVDRDRNGIHISVIA